MKTIFRFLIICDFACKKEGKESDYLLSKEYTDGLITREYIYGNDKLTKCAGCPPFQRREEYQTPYTGNPAGSVVVYTYSNRKYNNQGYLISETEKMKSSGSIKTWEHTYEYISQ
jgi:hypothetical protein